MTNFELLQNVDFDNSYNHVIDFDSQEQQEQYFDNKVVAYFDDFTIVRENEAVKIEMNINLVRSNYCRFTNTINGVEKTVYAFIVSKEYVNPDVTRLILEVDVWQTYLFDYKLKQSFIDRQHKDRLEMVNNVVKPKFDLIPENLEAGSEYDILSQTKIVEEPHSDLIWYCFLLKKSVNSFKTPSNHDAGSDYYNNPLPLEIKEMSTDVYCYLAPSKEFTVYTYDVKGNKRPLNSATDMVRLFFKSNETVSIKALPYCPIKHRIDSEGVYIFDENFTGEPATKVGNNIAVPLDNSDFKVDFSNLGNDYPISDYGGHLLQVHKFNSSSEHIDIYTFNKKDFMPNSYNLDINSKRSVENETKLKTSPYEFLELTNYQTNPLNLKIEYLPDVCNVKFRQNLDITAKSKVWVEDYNNDKNGKVNSAINATLNEVTLWNDAYQTYLSQHRASATTGVALNIATGVGMLALGVATGGVGLVAGVAGAVGVGTQIANELIQREDLKQTPDNVSKLGNNLSFDILDDNIKYFLTHKSIKPQFKELIFNYLSNYGYKSNSFEEPDTRSRYYFNYVKTIGANLVGDMTNNSIQKLKNIFDNGVTIWHYRSEETFKGLFNYELENLEVKLYNQLKAVDNE